jgi:hypothetical protein
MPAILIMNKNLSESSLGSSNDPTFLRMRPTFLHEIEQVHSALKAPVSRKRLHIIEQTFARRQFLAEHAKPIVY